PAILAPPAPPGPLMYMQFRQLLDIVRPRLLALGINPGGPLPSVSFYQPARTTPRIHWTDLFDWGAQSPPYPAGLHPIEQNLQASIETSLRTNIISSVLFASGARDFESLGLGYLWIGNAPPASPTEQAAASVVRILAQHWRWTGGDAQGSAQPPEVVDKYLEEASQQLGSTKSALQSDVERILGPHLQQWLANPDQMFVVSPRPDPSGDIETFVCGRCSCSHLH